MSANLVLHWHLDAVTPENRATDASDNHLNGIVEGDPQNQPDERFGSCLAFDGAADALTVPESPVLRVRAYTVEAWINADASQQALSGIADQSSGGFRLFLGSDGHIAHRFGTTVNPDDGHATAAGSVKWDTWQHVAITNDGRTSRIYVDGTQAGEYTYSGDRVVPTAPLVVARSLDVPLRGHFAGRMAHVRIYDGALTTLEIQRDMAGDEAALAAFVRTHPIDFDLSNQDQHHVLYIDDSPVGQPMTLRVSNTSRQDIELQPIDDTVSAQEHHIALRFRAETLAQVPQPRLTTPGWSLSRTADGGAFYLLSTAPATIHPGESVSLAFEGMNADGRGGTRGTRVELSYRRMRYVGAQEELTGTRLQFLDIVNHRGRRDIPLHVGFVSGDRVLSDGATLSTLRIRIANVSRDVGIRLRGLAAAPDEPSSFVVSFEVQESAETREWALVEAGRGDPKLSLGTEEMKAIWRDPGEPVDLGQSWQWTLTPLSDTTLEPDGALELRLDDVGAPASLGHAPVIVGYRNIPGYQDGFCTIFAEKSPLFFSPRNVGIGVAESDPLSSEGPARAQGLPEPEGRLQIIDVNQGANGKTLILGPTSQSNLRLGYHQNYSWIQSHGNTPLAINPIANKVGIGTDRPEGRLQIINVDQAWDGDTLILGPTNQSHLRLGYHQDYSWIQSDNVLAINPGHGYVGIGTYRPQGRLHIINAYEDANGSTFILGPTGGPNLRLGYYQFYSWIQAHGGRPLVINPVGNNVAIGTAHADARVTIGAHAEHLRLRREARDAGSGNILFLELFQDATATNVYPSIRFHHSETFWHRIEGRPEGFLLKTGYLDSDDLVDLYAKTAVLSALRIGNITIGERELRVLQEMS